jgi:enamine deaminase RidA (YjgF/YER057c/UK114 family)
MLSTRSLGRALAPSRSRLTTSSHRLSRLVHIEKKLEDLGIELPSPPQPKANYNIVCQAGADGNMLFISGHLPVQLDGSLFTGRIGPGHQSVDHGYQAARQAGLNILSTLKEQLGDLDRVKQVVKIFGIVQSSEDFKEQHKVMDGCSDLIMEVFGKDVGYHARSASK